MRTNNQWFQAESCKAESRTKEKHTNDLLGVLIPLDKELSVECNAALRAGKHMIKWPANNEASRKE